MADGEVIDALALPDLHADPYSANTVLHFPHPASCHVEHVIMIMSRNEYLTAVWHCQKGMLVAVAEEVTGLQRTFSLICNLWSLAWTHVMYVTNTLHSGNIISAR